MSKRVHVGGEAEQYLAEKRSDERVIRFLGEIGDVERRAPSEMYRDLFALNAFFVLRETRWNAVLNVTISASTL